MARKSRKHQQDVIIEQKSQKQYFAGIYARTSSKEQEGNSIENQIKIAQQHIQSNPDIHLHKTYVDYDLSSFSSIRPGFEELLSDLETGIINCAVVKDVSRFSRDFIETGELLQKRFPSWGVRFISINDGFDSLHDDATKIKIALQSLLNYSYSIDLSKKIQSAIRAKQENGTFTPARLPYGYIKSGNRKDAVWSVDEDASTIVQYIFNSALSGLSAFAIAGELNRLKAPAPNSAYWTSSGILRILRNVTYIGTFVTGKTRNDRNAEFKTKSTPPEKWIKYYNHHTPIIDESTFYYVQRVLAERSSPISAAKKIDDFFCGKLYCGVCGRKMRAKRSVNGNIYYICPRRDEASSSCANKSKSETKLKRQVFLILCELFEQFHAEHQEMLDFEKNPYFLNKMSEQNQLLQAYGKELDRHIQLIQTVYEYGVSNHLSRSADHRELMRYLSNAHSLLQNKISESEQSKMDYHEAKSLISSKYQMYLRFRDYDDTTEEMIEELINRVYVDFNEVRIESKI